ncbi:MAG: right-handed parallel beta-helix repeat-containing protein [Acidimicrobiales bacterium]
MTEPQRRLIALFTVGIAVVVALAITLVIVHDGSSGDASNRSAHAATDAASTWPNATDTGYANAPGYPGRLTECEGPIESGKTYRFCNFDDGVSVGTTSLGRVNDVTFYGCRFASNAVGDANVVVRGDNILFDYSTFEPSADDSPPVAYEQGYQYGIDQREAGRVTVDHSDFWGWGNAIQINFSSEAQPFVVRNSWFHDARDDGGIDHTDAILSNEGGPTHMVFDQNYIASVGNTQGLALQASERPYENVTITNNYFSGFGYSVAIGEELGGSNITFVGNTFGTDIPPDWGPLYTGAAWVGETGNVWRDNRWRVAPGSDHQPSSDDGRYWWPDGSRRTTDYEG